MSAPRPASRSLAFLLILAGVALALFAAFADSIGFGAGEGFGYYQMIFLIGGIATSLVGVAMLVHGWSSRGPGNDFEPEP
jgi:hypothetical protein